MSNKTDVFKPSPEVCHYAKIYTYPCGVVDILCSTAPVFREQGWEDAHAWRRASAPKVSKEADTSEEKAAAGPDAADVQRSMRRARARVRRLALANDFRWFVTLTLAPDKVDRYDAGEVVRKLSQWCNNQVKRRGLKYVLVPERHKDGALHFHGFFSDCLEAVASGHADRQGHMIYNLPGWTLGFTAAIEVYGDYAGAVAYVCKYIGKQGDKPAGRWYYSGGNLAEPDTAYTEISPRDLVETYGDKVYLLDVPGSTLAICNGIREQEDMA